MTRMVQLAVAADLAEADAIEAILGSAGISYTLERAVEQHEAGLEDAPQRVLVPETELEAARNAIEALSDPEDVLDA
jgi:hypothetical protein